MKLPTTIALFKMLPKMTSWWMQWRTALMVMLWQMFEAVVKTLSFLTQVSHHLEPANP